MRKSVGTLLGNKASDVSKILFYLTGRSIRYSIKRQQSGRRLQVCV